MTWENFATIVNGVAWPVAVLIIILLLRKAVAAAIGRLRGIEGPTGWKLAFEMRRVGEQLDRVEAMTKDIYQLTGEPLKVREGIWEYIADILNKVSPDTAFEMRMELNKYHIPRLGTEVSELKQMLSRVNGLYKPDSTETKSFNNEITQAFVEAVFDFQKSTQVKYPDGIIGPQTIEKLTAEASKHA
jgi:murein L,D-transpeptidase YcbB/YkuD